MYKYLPILTGMIAPSECGQWQDPVIYIGEITHPFLQAIADNIEICIEHHDWLQFKYKKRIYHICIELLQNIYRHGKNLEGTSRFPLGFFQFGLNEDLAIISTANITDTQTAKKVADRIEYLRPMTIDNLKSLHKMQLTEGSMSEKGGAGLGLIDIARKAGKPLEINSVELQDEMVVMQITVKVDLKM